MKAHHIAGSMLLALGACSQTPESTETARSVIGPGGGIISSLDSVLTIAIPPGALEEEQEFYIERTNEPPDVFGQAYLLRPNPEVKFDVTVTVRQELPNDTSTLAVGAIDFLDYEEGRGGWVPLPVLRIDREEKLVSGVDDGLSIFYALLDDASEIPSTSSGNSTTTGADPATTDDPGTTTGDPGTTTDEPGTTTDEPGTTTDEPGTTTGEAALSFAMDIEPIVLANCNCHTAGGPPEGLDLSDGYANLVDVPSNQSGLDRIEPGDPDQSYLWHKINDTHLSVGGANNPMPAPAGGLAAGDIALIEEWILDGAEP